MSGRWVSARSASWCGPGTAHVDVGACSPAQAPAEPSDRVAAQQRPAARRARRGGAPPPRTGAPRRPRLHLRVEPVDEARTARRRRVPGPSHPPPTATRVAPPGAARPDRGVGRRAALAARRPVGVAPHPLEDVGDRLGDGPGVDAVGLRCRRSAGPGGAGSPHGRAVIESVMVSAYMTTRPLTLRAARPMVWISEDAERRKPSLSASRMATRATSGRSRPSRSRLMPTRTSNDAQPELAEDLDAGHRVDVGVEVLDPDPLLGQVVGQVLGHLLGQRGHEDPVARAATVASIRSRRSSICPVVGRMSTSGSTRPVGRMTCSTTLALCSSSHGPGVADSRMVWPVALDELLEAERPVVDGRGEPEPVVDQGLLAGPVPGVLAAELGDGHVALVEDHQEVLGEEVEQGERRLARGPAVEVAAVVLDPAAHAGLGEHLEVVLGPHPEPLGLEQLAGVLSSSVESARGARPRCCRRPRACARRPCRSGCWRRPPGPRDRRPISPVSDVERPDPLDRVAEELDPDRPALVGGVDLDGVAARPELATARG